MPTLSYMLELTPAEFLHLWTLLTMRTALINMQNEEVTILEKLNRFKSEGE